MLETKLFHVEAVNKSVNEPDGIFFVNVFVDGVWKQHCLVSVGSVYVFAHGSSVALKLALSFTISGERRKRLFTQSDYGSNPAQST